MKNNQSNKTIIRTKTLEYRYDDIMSVDDPLTKSDRNKSLIWIVKLLLNYKLLLIIVTISLILTLGLQTLIPVLIGELIDNTILTQNLSLFEYLIALILIVGLIRVFFNYIMIYTFSILHWRIIRNVRELFFNTIQKKPLKFHDKVRSGDFMALATFDTNMFSEMIDPGIRQIANVILTMAFFVIFGVMQNIVFALILAPFMIIYVWAVLSYNKKMKPVSEFFERKWSLMSITAQDNISGASIVRAYNGEEYEKKHFRTVVETFRDVWYQRQMIQARYWPLLIVYFMIGFSFFAGILMVNYGGLSIGELIAFNGMLLLLIQPTNMISWAITGFQAGLAGGGRIYRFMNLETDESEAELEPFDFSKLQGTIELRNVTFNYPNTLKPALKDISLTINAGETIAIVGASGSGKSTLTKLILRLYDDYQGKILLDGVDILHLPLTKLRQNVGRVEQDVFIFATSVKNNILFGADPGSKTDQDVIEAAKNAQAHDFIQKMPNQYDSILGERGIGLSGGQKQRIAIARCFILNPKIMILDDTTSAIDSKTEELLSKAIANITKDRTTLMITHRISSIIKADKIVFLKNGTVLAVGKHQELYDLIPDYRRIFDSKRKYLTPTVQKIVPTEAIKNIGGD